MIPLCITSVAGASAIIFKWLALSSPRILPEGLVRQISDFSSREETSPPAGLLAEASQGGSCLARLAHAALRHQGKPRQEITLAVEAASRQESSRLHAGTGIIDVVITVAPLLGLLGTASGLVTIFQGLGDAADHLTIARGIAEALNTTIFGLAIAVPCVIAQGYFSRRIEVLTARMESLLADLAGACSGSAAES